MKSWLGHKADQSLSVTSSLMGDLRFGNCFARLLDAMLSKRVSSKSDGCQTKPGTAAASSIMCWPVPLAISRAFPLLGEYLQTKSIIWFKFLSAAGECRHPPLFSWTTLAVGGMFLRKPNLDHHFPEHLEIWLYNAGKTTDGATFYCRNAANQQSVITFDGNYP